MKKIIINTDGASRSNPGPAAASFVIQSEDGKVIDKKGIFLGTATNNEAEYLAVKLAFEKLIDLDIQYNHVEVITDSLLIAMQLAGKYRVKNDRLRILYNEVKELEERIGLVKYNHTLRVNNTLADSLANEALDEQLFGKH